jgi:spore germination cell wall hydrolase CwlJ-like protein
LEKFIALVIIIILMYSASHCQASSLWPKTENDCLAANVYFEARGESLVGQYMVAWVTINRVKSLRYPNTICEVVKEYKQFSWYKPWKEQFPKDKDAWGKACSVAAKFLLNSPEVRTDLSEGAMYYHADYVAPAWRLKKTYLSTVGKHIFYR